MVEPIGVLMAMLLLRRTLRTRHRIAISVLRNDGFFLLLLLLLLLLRLLWRLLQRFSVQNRFAESSYERCLLMFVRPVMIVPGMIMMVVVVVTRVIVPMMVMMTVRQ